MDTQRNRNSFALYLTAAGSAGLLLAAVSMGTAVKAVADAEAERGAQSAVVGQVATITAVLPVSSN